MDILPITDWSQESVRPALNLVLRRLERLFSKIYKKHVLRVSPLQITCGSCGAELTFAVVFEKKK